MPKFEIEYTEAQLKAVKHIILNPLEWLQHAWNDKARRCVDRTIEEMSDFQAKKLTDVEKTDFILNNTIPERTE